jgi:hypothetical protein
MHVACGKLYGKKRRRMTKKRRRMPRSHGAKRRRIKHPQGREYVQNAKEIHGIC